MDLKKYLPKEILKILMKNDFLSKPFFLEGTTIFADISGFTQLSEELNKLGREGAEILTNTLNFYFDNLISIIYKNGGDIMRFAGDAITAFFPKDLEENALFSSIEIQNFFKENEIARTSFGEFSIKIKIGIATGRHTLMILGEEPFFDYVFAGIPVDKAAEAEHNALAGEVVFYKDEFIKIDQSKKFCPKKIKEEEIDFENEKIKKFLNPILYKKISSGFEKFLNEHRKCAVLFLSFKGLKSYENEEDLKFLNNFYIDVRERVEKFEGFLNKVDFGDKGSKFLITFGAPLSHEDDIDRAIYLSKEIQDISKKEKIDLKIGLNSGIIFSGIVGNEKRCEYTVMGDSVNLSARLMQFAKEGETILSSSISKGSKAFSFEKIKEIEVKGKKEPVSIFKIMEEKSEREEEFFFGRKNELDEAVNFIKEKEKEPKLLEITGEAGVGKTSFIFNLKENLPGFQFYYIQIQQLHKNFPFYSLKNIIKEILQREKNIEEIFKGEEISKYSFVLFDFAEISHNLKRIKIPEETRRAILQKEILILLNYISKEKNNLICFDNFQWIDDESLKVIENILKIIDFPAPAFIFSGREKTKLNFENKKEIEIKRFSDKEIYKFLSSFLNIKEVPKKVYEKILKVGGNPLQIKENIKNFFEIKYIERDSENPEILIVDERKEPKVATFEELILTKIDKISPQKQFLLKIFSIFGTEVPKKIGDFLIDELKIEKENLKEILKEGEFLKEEKESYIFSQNIIRTTIYETLDFKTRQEFHKKIASSFLKFLPETHPQRDEILSYHFIEGKDIESGAEFIKMAGEKAYNSFSYSISYNLFSKIYKFQDGDILYKLCDSILKIGQIQEIEKIVREEIEKIEDFDKKAKIYKVLSDSHRLTGNFNLAVETLDEGLKICSENKTKFEILLSKAVLFSQFSKYEDALKIFDELEKLEKYVPKEEIYKSYTIKGPLYFAVGKKEEGIEILKKAKDYFKKKKEIFSLIKTVHNLGTFYEFEGMHKNSIFYLKYSKDLQEKFGIFQYFIITLNEIGCEYMLLGKWKDAKFYFDYALSFAKKTKDPFVIAVYLNLNELNQYFGNFKEGRDYLKSATIESYKFNYMRLDVLFYWIEYLILIGYKKPLFKFLERFKKKIEEEKAYFLKELYLSYLVYANYLNGNYEEAIKIGKDALKKIKEKGLKKEEYIITKIFYLILKDEKYLKRLKELSAEMAMPQYKIEAMIFEYERNKDKNLYKKIKKELKKTPFYNLKMKFESII